MCRRDRRARGFALLIVLWAIALAALIGTEVTSLGRRETRIAANLRDAASAEAAADGAVYEAIYRLMRNEAGWDGDGAPHEVAIGRVRIAVAIRDERGKLNLNFATPAALAALFAALGIESGRAERLAAAVAAWRGGVADAAAARAWAARYRAAGKDYVPTFEPFRSVAELGLVLGMSDDDVRLIAPHVTVYGTGGVDRNFADPAVAAALATLSGPALAAATEVGPAATPRILSIDARATGPGRGVFDRHAIVRLGGGTSGFAIFRWTQGPP